MFKARDHTVNTDRPFPTIVPQNTFTGSAKNSGQGVKICAKKHPKCQNENKSYYSLLWTWILLSRLIEIYFALIS